MTRRCTWIAVFGCLALCLAGAATAAGRPVKRPPVPAGEGTAAAEAQRLWSSLLTHCGESWFYAGSAFDTGGVLADASSTQSPLMEYRGVRFTAVPVRVTEAERLNGIEAEARIAMISSVYRQDGGVWSDGPALRPRNTGDVLGLALQDANSDMFTLGNSGSMALLLVRINGKWVVSRTGNSSDMSLQLDPSWYDVEKLIASTLRHTCADLTAKARAAAESAAAKAASAGRDEDQ